MLINIKWLILISVPVIYYTIQIIIRFKILYFIYPGEIIQVHDLFNHYINNTVKLTNI